MGMTLTQKILANAAGKEKLNAGNLINIKIDIVLGNDITTPVAIREFKKFGFNKVFDNNKIAIVLDHFVPNKDIKSAEQSKICRDFAYEQNIKHFYDVGKMGIEHALLPELGIVTSGDVIIGADSHTCTYGALGAFSTGVGSTDMAYAMATGYEWFKVPPAIKIILNGKLNNKCSGKDIILTLIGKIGVDGALYKSLEFVGDGTKNLSMDDRFCICNMAIEAGAKNGIFEYDDITKEYLDNREERPRKIFKSDQDAIYDEIININLDEIEPVVSCPHLPKNVKNAKELNNIKIDQVVIGSCTNGRMEDMISAYEVLKGNKVKEGVRCIIIPATMNIYKECIERGMITEFINAGAVVSTPTCGPCLGGYMGILAKGEKCISTTNRNFVGRMGHTESEVYLASPRTAAKSAIAGYITD